MSAYSNSLIPARFLSLIGHMTILIIIFWSLEESSRKCLRHDQEEDDLIDQMRRMKWGVSLALAFIVIEFLGFLSGCSMFHPSYAILNIGCHGFAAIVLSLSLLQTYSCSLYWWIFVVCSALPVFIECIIIFNCLVLRKESI
ncbi:hypothetical protein M8J76_004974 [Diaphorina citri]|nr:hypothetical protein M8J75_009328 [Diaphorina citri]KAI5744761.1 hypothetical protein M8J76_004974 [Diaphorina citri]